MDFPRLTFTAHGEEHTIPAAVLAKVGEYARRKAADSAETPGPGANSVLCGKRVPHGPHSWGHSWCSGDSYWPLVDGPSVDDASPGYCPSCGDGRVGNAPGEVCLRCSATSASPDAIEVVRATLEGYAHSRYYRCKSDDRTECAGCFARWMLAEVMPPADSQETERCETCGGLPHGTPNVLLPADKASTDTTSHIENHAAGIIRWATEQGFPAIVREAEQIRRLAVEDEQIRRLAVEAEQIRRLAVRQRVAASAETPFAPHPGELEAVIRDALDIIPGPGRDQADCVADAVREYVSAHQGVSSQVSERCPEVSETWGRCTRAAGHDGTHSGEDPRPGMF